MELVRYIHLNLVRAGVVQRPEEYEYSSHGIYLRGKATEVVNPSRVLQLEPGLLRGFDRFRGRIEEPHEFFN